MNLKWFSICWRWSKKIQKSSNQKIKRLKVKLLNFYKSNITVLGNNSRFLDLVNYLMVLRIWGLKYASLQAYASIRILYELISLTWPPNLSKNFQTLWLIWRMVTWRIICNHHVIFCERFWILYFRLSLSLPIDYLYLHFKMHIRTPSK